MLESNQRSNFCPLLNFAFYKTYFVSKIKPLILQFSVLICSASHAKKMAPVKNISDGSGAHTSKCPGCELHSAVLIRVTLFLHRPEGAVYPS